MKTTIMGSYPKIPAGPGPSVRTAIQRFEKGQISPEQLYSTYESVVKRVVDLAADAQCDRTTDGQIRWYDLFDPVVRDLDNVYSAGLLRLFDNNFYVRHPVVTGRLQYQGGTLAAWSREAASLSRIPVTIVLPGLFTFLSMVEDKNYHNEETLLSDLVDVMRLTVCHLADTGIVEVQWDEPALARYADRWPTAFVQEAYQKLLALEGPLEQSLALYWGPSSPWLDTLAALPFARLSFDAVSEPAILDRLASHTLPASVGVGIIDGRNVRMEDAHQVVDILEPVLRRQGSDRVWVHPNCGLEFLPPDRAAAKVRLLQDLKTLING
ncbi:MAG: synthase [Sulfobacillus thermotolerans]|nr:synthase [Sulfobacillus thermotolerans]